jgi:hypothetical protein
MQFLIYCYDAEDSPSNGDASRQKVKQTFENNFKNLFKSSRSSPNSV